MAHATLTVWRFDSATAADEAVSVIEQLARERVVRLHDAATVSWAQDETKPRTRQLASTTGSGALGGTFWGLLFGLLFFMPLLGAALGAATGALTGALTDVGIDDGFINKIRDQVTPGTSAVFLMTSDAVLDRIRDAFAGQAQPELIFTNLSPEQESALRGVFADE